MIMFFRQLKYFVSICLLVWIPVTVAAGDVAGIHFSSWTNYPDSSHSPKRAAILSALLPGAGQAYNRKYWKMPIVYAAGITGGYMIVSNSRDYKSFKQAYIYRSDDDSTTIDNYPKYSASQLKVFRDHYRRNTELSIILTTAVYLLQILDATVDAHLFEFDVTNNLAVRWHPFVLPAAYSAPSPGLGLSLTFSLRK